MSPTQSPTMPAAILETIVFHLAALFLAGAGGDIDAARDAARHMLMAHHRKPRPNSASPPTSSATASKASKPSGKPRHRTCRSPASCACAQRRQPQPRIPQGRAPPATTAESAAGGSPAQPAETSHNPSSQNPHNQRPKRRRPYPRHTESRRRRQANGQTGPRPTRRVSVICASPPA